MKAWSIEAQGLQLRVWDHGGSGPVVLLVHGYLDTGRSFDAIAEALPDARVLALDLRGHGQSHRVGAGGSYHLLDHLKDLALVLQALQRQQLPVELLVGHSMGGNITLMLAGAAPDMVKRLLLLDTFGPPPDEPEEQPERLASLVQSVLEEKRPFSSVATVQQAADKIRAQNPGLSPEAALRMVRDVMVPRDDGALDFPFDPRLRGPSPVRYPESMWLSLCRRVTASVLLVRASDGYVPEGETLDARVAALRARTLTLAGPHHLHVQEPESVAAVLRQHLTG